MPKLTDKPTKWKQVLCQQNAVNEIQGLLVQMQADNKTRSENKRAFFITGETGVGKDTLSGLIANFVTDNPFITETTGNLLTAEECRHIAENVSMTAMAKRVFVVKEAQKLTAHVCTMLLEILESNAQFGNYVFVFTAMEKVFEHSDETVQRNFRALGDRCNVIALQDKNSEQFRSEWKTAMRRIADENGITGIDIEKLGKDVHYSIRGGLGRIQQSIETRLAARFREKSETFEKTLTEVLYDIIALAGKDGIAPKDIFAELKRRGESIRIRSEKPNELINAILSKEIQRHGKKCRIKKENRRFYAA